MLELMNDLERSDARVRQSISLQTIEHFLSLC